MSLTGPRSSTPRTCRCHSGRVLRDRARVRGVSDGVTEGQEHLSPPDALETSVRKDRLFFRRTAGVHVARIGNVTVELRVDGESRGQPSGEGLLGQSPQTQEEADAVANAGGITGASSWRCPRSVRGEQAGDPPGPVGRWLVKGVTRRVLHAVDAVRELSGRDPGPGLRRPRGSVVIVRTSPEDGRGALLVLRGIPATCESTSRRCSTHPPRRASSKRRSARSRAFAGWFSDRHGRRVSVFYDAGSPTIGRSCARSATPRCRLVDDADRDTQTRYQAVRVGGIAPQAAGR